MTVNVRTRPAFLYRSSSAARAADCRPYGRNRNFSL